MRHNTFTRFEHEELWFRKTTSCSIWSTNKAEPASGPQTCPVQLSKSIMKASLAVRAALGQCTRLTQKTSWWSRCSGSSLTWAIRTHWYRTREVKPEYFENLCSSMLSGRNLSDPKLRPITRTSRKNGAL